MYRNKFKSPAHSRRGILKALGASAVLSPFLPLLNASGQETLFPKRLLLFFSPDGTASIDHGGMIVNWKPSGTETDFTLQYQHEPLVPIQHKIIVPHGLKMSAGGAGQEHAFGMSGLWSGARLNEPSGDANFDGGNGQRTGWGSGPSIDQIVAAESGPDMPYTLPATEAETPYRTLELGAQCQEPHSMHRMIYKGNEQPIHPEVNPSAAFDRLFGGGVNVSTQSAPTEEASGVRAASVDLLLAETEALRTKVGSEDYAKIDAHLEGLSAIRRRLDAPTLSTVGCTVPDGTWPAPTSQRENSASFPDEARAMMDIAVHSLSCDLTRVASVQLSRGFSGITHSWVGASQGHHTISHLDGDNTASLQEIDHWYAEQFAYLLTALDSIQEGDGTLLDNTLVVWGREMGATNHRMQPVNLIFAGSARGAITPGRFLDVNNEPHAKALVSIAHAMGLDINSVGDINADSGPLAGLV